MKAACSCGCGRPATKASGYTWAYWCDPSVEATTKLQARQLGGRRGQLTPAETARLFDELEPGSAEPDGLPVSASCELLAVGKIPSSSTATSCSPSTACGQGPSEGRTSLAPALVVEVRRFAANGAETVDTP